MPNILPALVPLQVSDNCVETAPVNCGPEGPKASTTDKTLNIEYPRNKTTLPLAGGAIISINAEGLKLKPSKNVTNILARNLTVLSGLELKNKLSDLNRSRVAVNNALFDIARRDLKVVSTALKGGGTKQKAPFVYFSIFTGEDSGVLSEGVSNPDMSRVCEFRYIPAESFSRLLDNLLDESSIEFEDIVGVSGRTYADLKTLAKDIANTIEIESAALELSDIEVPEFPSIGGADPDLIDLVMEFFPIVNMSETSLSSSKSNTTMGGYYTIVDGTLYLKMPDLSGRDSAGNPSTVLSANSSLWIEVISGAALTRVEIDNFKLPPMAAFVGSQQTEFPDSISLDVVFELAEEGSTTVYLSPIVKGVNVTKERSIDSFSGGIELFSVPLLTAPITSTFADGREGIINEGSSPSSDDVKALSLLVDPYYPGFSESDINPKRTGYQFVGQQDAHAFFGEKNRPEIILSNGGRSSSKNDNRYYNLSAYGVLKTLVSTMPKIYKDVPSEWVSAIPTQDDDGNYVARFSASDFEGIDLAHPSFDGTIEYAVYVRDGSDQLTRIAGPNLTLFAATPSIEKLQPDGFNGGTAIILSETNTIEITGEDLAGVQLVKFENTTSGQLINIAPGFGIVSNPTSTSISLNFNAGSMAGQGFSAGEYKVKLQGAGPGLESGEDSIYIIGDEGDDQINKGNLLAKFDDDELSSLEFGAEPVIGIPLFKNGTSAKIGIKSKSKLFDGKRDVFAYIALPSNDANKQIVSEFAFPDRTISLTGSKASEELLVPIDISYQFSRSIVADFAAVPFSNKKATLNFPGNSYAGYNFSSLEGIDRAYILLTNRPIAEVVGSGTTLTLEAEDHDVLVLGSDEAPAFIEPSTVQGFAIEVESGNVISSFQTGKFKLPGFSLFGGAELTVGQASTFGKISTIAVIVSGINEKFLRKRYDIKLGGESIMNKLSREPESLEPGKILFVFDDVTPKSDGLLSITVDKKEKRFGSNYTTTGYSGQGTAVINDSEGVFYEVDPKTRTLTLKSDITSEQVVDDLEAFIEETSNLFGIVGSTALSTNVLDTLYPDSQTNGLIFDPTLAGGLSFAYKPFVPVDITASAKLKLGLDPGSTDTTTLIPGFTETMVSYLARNVLVLGSGSAFFNGSYVLNQDSDAALLFFNAVTQKLASIKYNVPEVISIAEEGGDPIILAEGGVIPIIVGNLYDVIVENTDPDFTLQFDLFSVKSRGEAKLDDGPEQKPGRYKVTIKAPISLLNVTLSAQKCFDVCASTDNATRNRAKRELGRAFVVDLDEIFQDMLLGPLKDKIPDIGALFEKLADAPLKFVQLLLDKANIPKDLIKSFCDLSFHLVAELKISLNGFRILMIPIQIIFCIIDVICSLLNPIKLAKAIIRLFQCLYDLILLLPQISVPVMFFQLILHLLELLKCVIDKILFTITAINEIIKALNNAGQKPINFPAIKALEETLSEYLFEIDADLEFLEPILSILAIFLQLLQLVFRFPCSISPGEGQPDCGVDGTMLAGIVAGIAAPDLENIDPNVMLPVGQTYSTDSLGSTTSVSEPIDGDVIASASGGTYLDSMALDEDSLRSTGEGSNGLTFNATMAPSFTKSSKSAGKPAQIKFKFNGRGESTSLNEKNVDPNQSLDTPMFFCSKTGSKIRLNENGNLYSPIDGEAFLNVNGDKASVKPLIIDLEVPIFSTDPVTGMPVQTGIDTVTRTFDNIPKMVIMDDEFNVYFIQDGGIEFDSDGQVDSITADIVNTSSAPKMRFSKEEIEIDLDNDPDTDEGTIKIFDFPQIYFFDMRQASDQLEQFCSTSSINSFPFEDNSTEDIEEIVEDAQGCLEAYLTAVRGQVSSVRDAARAGTFPLTEISIDDFSAANETLEECLDGTIDGICKYVVNSLNTSFKVLEDDDETPLEDFTDGDISEDVLGDFDASGPAFTGAREYAAGIGDSATVEVGEIATIEIIPRDAYDDEIIGDLSERVILEITGDTSGDAEFLKNSDGKILTRDGTTYTAQLTSSKIGEVKIKARVCDRTVQALTFDGIDEVVVDENEIDCIPDATPAGAGTSSPFGALTKVDRILNIYFVKVTNPSITGLGGDDTDKLPITDPQQFGSGLEN
jgi:hypothetical protein